MRRAVPEAIHLALPVEMNEDISLPIQKIGDLLLIVEKLSQQYHLFSPVYGHIGDGNLHVTFAPKRKKDWRKDEPVTVSYTHLDVYKRQLISSICILLVGANYGGLPTEPIMI